MVPPEQTIIMMNAKDFNTGCVGRMMFSDVHCQQIQGNDCLREVLSNVQLGTKSEVNTGEKWFLARTVERTFLTNSLGQSEVNFWLSSNTTS